VAAGQVINRLQFTWTAIPARNAAESARAFAILFYITVAHWMMIAVLEISIFTLYPKPEESDEYVPIDDYPKPEGLLLVIIKFYNLLKWAYFIVIIFIVFSLRKSVRAKFGIPGSSFEDCCCAFWCNCLVVGQMLRHTTDYEVYPSQLCSSTGLSSKVGPMLV
jgi:Cys-rich protein (TIGR01571 family)